MSQNDILLCGLPESGKTTFLAALWYLLSQREMPTTLALRALPHQREYLNDISRKWSRFIPITRTPGEEVHEISLQLQVHDAVIDLHVPDMSGETWEGLWATRGCEGHVVEWIQRASGIMLFLHSDKVRPPLDIMTHNAMIEAVGGTPESGNSIEWSPKKTPTQVILVDVLQALSLSPFGKEGRLLAVVVSAWDKAEDTGMTPDHFLKVHLPLLHQFIKCSGCFSEIKVFGVSAQGGDLRSESDSERLKAQDVPSERIRVVEENVTTHDLTVPIHWLMK
ncbi:MAG: hypothetical protein C4576_20175 [Desulfobacteraceae bacterium]|nr:MAG: hypothetical protein C4576_20175 [Desulfobacteraceae bacterium]